VKAILLAAGYATRLYPLTENRPKTLLPVGGRPILDWITDKIDAVGDVDELHLVTNAKFADVLTRWAEGRHGRLAPIVHDDGTVSNDDRLGAIGDIRFVLDEAGSARDDLLVVAGDNLFEFGLDDQVRFWQEKGVASAVALYDCKSRELASQYGVATVDENGRITDFVEKPPLAPSTLVATAAYLYHREHVPMIDRYLAEGNSPDAPGNLVAWLSRLELVYGYRFDGAWFDIGDREQLLVADNAMRARVGLPQRDEYVPEPAHI
jgi:glucose-1-phosphate thymidylyltransferase